MTFLSATVVGETVEIEVERIVPLEEFRFAQKKHFWWAEKDGQVVFFSWRGPGNCGGFGGSRYDITMVDETSITLQGPWSSRPGVMNLEGFPPCMSVRLRAGDVVVYGNALVEEARKLVALERRPPLNAQDDEPVWVPLKMERT